MADITCPVCGAMRIDWNKTPSPFFLRLPSSELEGLLSKQAESDNKRIAELEGLLSKQAESDNNGVNDAGYQRYLQYGDGKKTYIQWLKTGMEYLEEAAHAAACGKNPVEYLATKAPTVLRDRIAELEAENAALRVQVAEHDWWGGGGR